MKKLQKHIDQFAEMLESKGYTEEYLINGFYGTCKSCLLFFFSTASDGSKQPTPTYATLSTVATSKADEAQVTTCHFHLVYHSETGFSIKEMATIQTVPSKPVQRNRIVIMSAIDIPPAGHHQENSNPSTSKVQK